jgi:tight adherence protein B
MIILWAILSGALCWAFFYFRDRRIRRKTELGLAQGQETEGDDRLPNANDDIGSGDSLHPSYTSYRLQAWERTLVMAVAGAIAFMLGYIFYRSLILALVLTLSALWAPRLYVQRQIRLRKELLEYQFKQSLYSLSTSLAAGRSVENAIRAAVEDMSAIYVDTKTDIVRELTLIVRRIDHGETLEQAFVDFAKRSDSEDIIQFSEMLVTCKRTGGDLVEAVRRTSQIISEKIEMQQEISVMVARKRFEAHALGIIPPMIIAFLSFGSPEYMAPLYSGGGRIIMTICLILFVGCYFVMRRMTDIKL